MCYPPPKPPPPPPPPPPDWPAREFNLSLEMVSPGMMGPETDYWAGVVHAVGWPLIFDEFYPGPFVTYVNLSFNPGPQTASLNIAGNVQLWGEFNLVINGIPITWNTVTVYTITDWDEFPAWMNSAEAIFEI